LEKEYYVNNYFESHLPYFIVSFIVESGKFAKHIACFVLVRIYGWCLKQSNLK